MERGFDAPGRCARLQSPGDRVGELQRRGRAPEVARAYLLRRQHLAERRHHAVGGLGVVGAANLGSEMAVFEAVHGSAPDIAGKNLANPTALLLSAVLMLRHIDEGPIADRVMAALTGVLAEDGVRTRDLGGSASTGEFTEAVCRRL